ncbi:hypothetical protein CTI14_14570 [Methylobacterium radiotolerans]|nr:hypothetical protein CTI14_14570 [Methylobacterium radiotolerans]
MRTAECPGRHAKGIVPATFETVTIMAGSASQAAFAIEEQRARIERAHEETRKFVAEQHKLIAEQSKLAAEQTRLAAEQVKMTAEASKTPSSRPSSRPRPPRSAGTGVSRPGRWRCLA